MEQSVPLESGPRRQWPRLVHLRTPARGSPEQSGASEVASVWRAGIRLTACAQADSAAGDGRIDDSFHGKDEWIQRERP